MREKFKIAWPYSDPKEHGPVRFTRQTLRAISLQQIERGLRWILGLRAPL